MNRKRRTVVVSAICLAAFGLTTVWGVLASDVWPPEAYQVYSMSGAWIESSNLDQSGSDVTVVTYSTEDPRTGTGFSVATEIDSDPTFGGLVPSATSQTPWYGTYVRTGPNTTQSRAVSYLRNDDTAKPKILYILVLETTNTQTSPDTIETVGVVMSYYPPSSDKDADGLPDADAQPAQSEPITQLMKRI